MLTDSYLSRFDGISRLYGINALKRFLHASICIVGIGGVGSWIAEAFARTGIGAMTLIDLDDVCISNINRQLVALDETKGLLKIDVMRDRILQINPECKITLIDDFLTEENMAEYLSLKFDYIIDAIDNALPKAAMIAHCIRNKKKIITIGSAGGKLDPSKIQITDLGKTIQDPLLAKVREKLRQNFSIQRNSKGKFQIPAVFSSEQLRFPTKNGEICLSKKETNSEKVKMDCNSGFGSTSVVTASFGFFAVSRVLDFLQKSG